MNVIVVTKLNGLAMRGTMKEKCENCKRELEVSSTIVMLVCNCGEIFDRIELKGGRDERC